MKKFVKLCYAILVLFAVLTASALAAEVLYSGTCGGEGDGSNLTWTLDDEGTLRIEGNGRMEYYSSYSSIPWYNYRSSIKSVVIDEGVTSIGSGAFFDCSGLTSVSIPSSVTSIGNSVFSGCSSLTRITVDENNAKYSSDERGVLFNKDKTVLIQYPIGNMVASYEIPSSVTSIGESAFSGCSSLTSVTIPEGVTSIGDFAFWGCSSLTTVTIPEGVTSIGWCTFFGCSSLTSVTIPEGVTSIGDEAFSGCSSLTSVTIPEGVTSIGYAAFRGCSSLTSVTIPDGVTSIGGSAFAECHSLTSVTIPEGVSSIGDDAFCNCSSLTTVNIPASVTSIGDYAFSGCSSLMSITVDENNAEYSNDERGVLFNKDKTTLIRYPIGNTATSYDIPLSVTSIGDYAFSGCSRLTSVTIPEGVTSIGDYTFYGCSSLTSVTIPEGVTSIGDEAFLGCRSLTSVTIPSSVKSIERKAFYECSSLAEIAVDENNVNYSSDQRGVLFDKDKTTLIQYPRGNTATSYEIPSSVTSIGGSAFEYCRSLTSVTIPEGVTSIGYGVFRDCSRLTSITVPSSLRSIGNYAFFQCHSFASMTIPTSVTSIGSSCFEVSGLKDIYYTGVKSQFVRINIGTDNATFNQATVHYQGVAVTGVSLNWMSLTLMQGEATQLIATVLPTNASDKTVTWSVTNPNVASVAEGVVSALNAGTTEIKATTADGGFTAACTVTVTAPPTIFNRDTVLVLDDSGSMNGTPLTELKKAAIKFCKNVLEANGNNRIALVIFETDTTVYDFTTDITSLTANINAMQGYGGTNTNYALQKANAFIVQSNADVKSVVLMTDGAPTCKESEVYTAAATVRSHATLFTLGFFHNIDGSEKTKAQQLLQAIKSEEYYYEVKDGSKLDESFFEISEAITKIPVTGLSLDKEKIVLTEGESLMLNASLEPHDTTERKIYWSSSNTAVATVSENGTVTAVSEGSVTVTAVSANTEIKAECTVIVNSSEAWYYTYTVKDDGTAEITGYRPGLQGDIVIPSYVHEYRVTSIGSRAFYDCRALTSAIIPAGVTSIGDYAFRGCSSLTSVTIQEGVTSIDRFAFSGCSSLTSVTISEGVTSIGGWAFRDCSSLTNITVDENNAKYSSDERGVLFNKDKTTLIQYPIGNTATSYEISEGVTSIDDDAFSGCSSLTSVIIPEGLTSIGGSAFSYCSSLTTVTIPSSVTSIGYSAFSGCSSLATVTIPSSVTSIQYQVFYGCKNLMAVTISEGITSIGNSAFSGCSSLASVTIPEGVTSIGQWAFSGCSSLATVTIPSSVTSIGVLAFNCSNLSSLIIDKNNQTFSCDERALFNKKNNCLIYYFCGNTSKNYDIPQGVESIYAFAFYENKSLVSITIPKSMKSIIECAFNNSNVKDIYYIGTEEEWKEIDIFDSNSDGVKIIPNATIHYNATVLTPSVTRTADGAVYKVSAANLPVSSVVVVALYKDGRFVGYESAVYNGETLEIAADTPHDTATILAWSDLEKLIPLAPGTKIGS